MTKPRFSLILIFPDVYVRAKVESNLTFSLGRSEKESKSKY